MQILYFILQEARNLPAWTRWIFVLLMFMTVLGVSEMVTPMVGIMVGAGILVVLGVVGLVQYFLKKRRDKQAAEFGEELADNSEATPGAVSDPGRRARLADLRKNFEKGLER